MEVVHCVYDVREKCVKHGSSQNCSTQEKHQNRNRGLLKYLEPNNATFEGGLIEVVNSSFESLGSIIEEKNWVQCSSLAYFNWQLNVP